MFLAQRRKPVQALVVTELAFGDLAPRTRVPLVGIRTERPLTRVPPAGQETVDVLLHPWLDLGSGVRVKTLVHGLQESAQPGIAATIDKRQLGVHKTKHGVDLHGQIRTGNGQIRRSPLGIPVLKIRQCLQGPGRQFELQLVAHVVADASDRTSSRVDRVAEHLQHFLWSQRGLAFHQLPQTPGTNGVPHRPGANAQWNPY